MITNDFCSNCKTYASVVPLDYHAGPNVQVFFKDSCQAIMKLIKVTAFQKFQSKNLINHLIREVK